VQYYEKLLNVAKGKLHEFNSRKQLLSKKYQKFNKESEEVPNTPKSNDADVNEKSKKKRINPIL
jgi:hypothetical protein